jgi:integrase
MRKRLSPRTIKALKPGRDGVRHGDVVMDDITPNFGVRVLGTGEKPSWSFVVVTRFPGSSNPVRAAIAPFVFDARDERVAAESLRKARNKARTWINLIEEGRDPRIEERIRRQAEDQRRLAEIRKEAMTFGAVAEAFIEEKLPGERRAKHVEREIRTEFKGWWNRPIGEITKDDVRQVISAKAKKAPASARNILGHAKRMFQWAIDAWDVEEGRKRYDIELSPASISPTVIVGEKITRERALDHDELFAFWRAVMRMPYPVKQAYQMLALTGCRLSEVADARWREFHPAVRTAIRQRGDAPIDWSKFDSEQLSWTIPAERMKGKNSKAKPHKVPLTPQMLALLEELPQFVGGDYLFSHTAGKSPAVISSDIKKALDARMLRTLRALAKTRGDDPAVLELKPWVNHDLRRSVRSGLSPLKVPEEVREAVLAHVRPGIKKNYDVHEYFDEKRDALVQWGARLRSIVEPAPVESNVVKLRG